jgi:hypothetical protein
MLRGPLLSLPMAPAPAEDDFVLIVVQDPGLAAH